MRRELGFPRGKSPRAGSLSEMLLPLVEMKDLREREKSLSKRSLQEAPEDAKEKAPTAHFNFLFYAHHSLGLPCLSNFSYLPHCHYSCLFSHLLTNSSWEKHPSSGPLLGFTHLGLINQNTLRETLGNSIAQRGQVEKLTNWA